MRHKGKHVGLARGGVILLLLHAFNSAFAAAQFPEVLNRQPCGDTAFSRPDPDGTARISRRPTGSSLHLEVGGSRGQYLHLSESYQFNPAARLMMPIATGWDRRWRDDRVWLQARYDVRVGDHLVFQPGLVLGAARGRFAAGNAGSGFSEEWLTRAALLAGLSLAAELHADPAHGPFLMAQYLFSRAEADEAKETVISDRVTNPDDRDARFRWLASEAILGLGCRWGAFKPMVGIAHTDVRLKKRLRYHIPEADVGGVDLEVVRALNGVASEYHFENKHPWAPFLELGWQATPAWALVARGSLAGRDGYSVGLRAGF